MSTVNYHLEELAIAKSKSDPRKVLPALPARFNSILDIGCGAGQTLVACDLNEDVLVCGVDIDEEALAFGHQMDKESGGHLHLSRAVGEALPFADDSFDVVISRVAVPYMHIPTALNEVARVLKAGGQIWFTLHPFSLVRGLLLRALKGGNVKSTLYFSYALLNGLAFHALGRMWRFPLNRARCESFQTIAGMKKALRTAGFAQMEIEQSPTMFVVKAIKA